ncbi:MAG: hypothetical protein KC431_05795 [Myxococcales bacterium]|nr:hypothetical protein [Myxococcales bacterium]
MAERSPKRPPRKTAVDDDREAVGAASARLADPETVVAVREATARTVHRFVRIGGRVAEQSAIAARWTWPRLSRLAQASGRGLAWIGRQTAKGAAALAGWGWRWRQAIARVGHRLLWWGALVILLLVGRALLGSGGDPEILASATIWFATGLSMSVLVMLGAPETRMRLGAFALAGGHGALGLLAHLVGGGA